MSVGFDLRCVRQEARLADRREHFVPGAIRCPSPPRPASSRSEQQPISNKLPCPSTTHELSCVIPSVSWLSMRFPETWAYVVPHVANHVASSVCRERFKDGGMCRRTTALVLCWRLTGRSLRRRVPLPPDQPTALAVLLPCSTSCFPVVHLSSSPYDTLDPRGPASTTCPSAAHPLACSPVHRLSLRRAALSSAPRPRRRAIP
ncbi:hypothetical protein HDK64DRAFT_103734 [Phyllosticta capitalensis]